MWVIGPDTICLIPASAKAGIRMTVYSRHSSSTSTFSPVRWKSWAQSMPSTPYTLESDIS